MTWWATKLGTVLSLAAMAAAPTSAQQVMPLWQAPPPGSEDWTFAEKVTARENGGSHIADVTRPTLTVYLPRRSRATGTAVVIAPGGGMVGLEVPGYAKGPEKWFNDRGIAVFVLKYRVLPTAWQVRRRPPTLAEFPHANANPFPEDQRMAATIGFAIADARQALKLIRSHAADWDIDPHKVGMLGYSAGGGVAIGAAVAPAEGAAAEKPDFVISVYGPSLVDVDVGKDAPPLFLAVRQFHPNVARALVAVFEEWTKAGAPAELHVYDQLGGSPFLPDTGEWLDRAHEWMKARGFGVVPAAPAAGRRPAAADQR